MDRCSSTKQLEKHAGPFVPLDHFKGKWIMPLAHCKQLSQLRLAIVDSIPDEVHSGQSPASVAKK
jgi:hypothetical protein